MSTETKVEQNPQTAAEAQQIINALLARIAEREADQGRLQDDRNTLSETIASREVDDAVGLSGYGEKEKQKHWNTISTLDVQIGQGEVTLTKLRERLKQAEIDLLKVQVAAEQEALPPVCSRINEQVHKLNSQVAAISQTFSTLKSLYEDYDANLCHLAHKIGEHNTKRVENGEDVPVLEPSKYEVDLTLPNSHRPALPPGTFLDFRMTFWDWTMRWENLLKEIAAGAAPEGPEVFSPAAPIAPDAELNKAEGLSPAAQTAPDAEQDEFKAEEGGPRIRRARRRSEE